MSQQTSEKQDQEKTIRRRAIEWSFLGVIVLILVAIIVMSIGANREELAEQSLPTNETPEFDEIAQRDPMHVEYAGLNEDNVFVRASDEDIVSTMREGTGVVLLGFPECPWCQGLLPIVDEAARNIGLEEVKYLDIRESRQNSDDTYLEIVDILSDHLPTGDDGQPIVYVPDMTIFRDGEIVFRYEAESATAEESTPDTFWTEERTERVREQLEVEFQSILGQ